MRRFIKIMCFFILVVCLDARLTQADDSIGAIKKLNGAATVVREKAEHKVNIGAPVFMKDVLKTDKTGSLGITFKDNTMISVGPNTVYTIDEYVYQPNEQKLAFVSKVSKGTLHFVSGNLAKLAPDAVKVKTPEATIGFRGTRFLIKVEDY
ncbi:MAG TPA: FecR family protein [bacterium]